MRLTVYAIGKEPAQEKLEPAELDETIGDDRIAGSAHGAAPFSNRCPEHRAVDIPQLDARCRRTEQCRDRVEVVLDGFVRELCELSFAPAVHDGLRHHPPHRRAHQAAGDAVARLNITRDAH